MGALLQDEKREVTQEATAPVARSGVNDTAAEDEGPTRRLHAKQTAMRFCEPCDRTTEHNVTSTSVNCKNCGHVELLKDNDAPTMVTEGA